MIHLFGIQGSSRLDWNMLKKIPFSEEGLPEKQQDRDFSKIPKIMRNSH
jgi:hypothetical protein